MILPIDLRHYQETGIEQVRELYRRGVKRVCLVAPTGAGKTLIAAYLMREAGKKQTRTAFLVDRVALVDQTSAVFDRHGIDHGVIQGAHFRSRGYEPIQVCSAQTLEKRGFFPDLKFLVVDEAHCIRQQTAEFMRSMDRLPVLGLTATPFAEGMGKLYTALVNVTTTNKLIEEGFLVPLKIFASVRPDMRGAKTGEGGEWTADEVESRGIAILGNVVDEWEQKTDEHFGGPVKTLVFSANVAHGEALAEAFNRQGHNFVQISYKDGASDSPERRAIIEEFRKPDSRIRGLISCEVLTKGFDCPDVMCGISARPYRRSFSSHIQQLGRLMRPADGKTFALWLDHSGNALRFLADQENLFEHGVKSLDDAHNPDKKKRNEDDVEKTEDGAKCPACTAIMPPKAEVCPACGFKRPRRETVETGEGVMVAIGKGMVKADGKYAWLADQGDVWRQLVFLSRLKKPDSSEKAEKWALAQHMSLYKVFPPRGAYARTEPKSPDARLVGLIKQREIAYFHAVTRGR